MATIKVKNPSSIARTGVVTFGVPFTRGFNLLNTNTLVASNAVSGVSNLKVHWYPQGARWDNNGIKYARCALKVELDANEEKEIVISRSTTSTTINYAASTTALSGLGSTNFIFTIQGTTFTMPMATVLTGHVIEGSGSTDYYRRIKYFTHLPATSNPQIRHVWVELVLDLYSQTPFTQFYFRWGYYRFEPTVQNVNGVDPRMDLTQPVRLQVIGPRTSIRWENQVTTSIQNISNTNRIFTLLDHTVPNENRIVAGASHCYKGVFAFDSSNSSLAELDSQILAMAVDWKTMYPITGIMPDTPSYITSEADALSRSNALLSYMQSNILATRGAHNWSNIINSARTADAGAHGSRDYAYGMRGWPILSTTNVDWIPYLEYTTRTQALRHNWYYKDSGIPVSPSEFLNNTVVIWNGTFHVTGGGGERFCGYNRTFAESDVPVTTAPIGYVGARIFGPDKEHFTNKMFILQGLITMDWFSLEYAKMYSKYWIHANRTDYYGGWPSDANIWGVPRAIGRVSEVAAWLLEFYNDSELRYMIDIRLSYNLGRSRAQLLNKTLFPGGIEVIRSSDIQVPCTQAACLNTLEHWRPWEEAQFVLGQFLLAKQLLTSNPLDPTGLRTLETAKDVAATVLLNGYMDGRSSTTRRFVTVIFSDSTGADSFKANIGNNLTSITAQGLSSGATGTIYMYFNDVDLGGTIGPKTVKLHLRNATGSFILNETLRLSTGAQATVYRLYSFIGGAKSMALTSPTNGYARELTNAELEAHGPPGEDVNYTPPSFPAGYFKYAYWFYLYEMVQIQAAVLARQAAQEGYYSDNVTIIAKANDLIDFYSTGGYNQDNGDFEESFLAFAGYLVPDLFNTSQRSFAAGTLTSTSSVPTATATAVINNINVSRTITNASVKTVEVRPSSVTAVGTNGSTDVQVVLPSLSMYVSAVSVTSSGTQLPGLGSVSSSANVTPTSSENILVTASDVDSVYTSTTTLGKRTNQYVYMDLDADSSDPTFVHEVIDTSLPLSQPGGQFIYLRVLPIIGAGNPITDYYLATSIHPLPSLIGEAVGLNGQSFGSQGYTWVIPSVSSDPFDTVEYDINTPNFTHIIDQDRRGHAISKWEVTLNITAITVNLLRVPNRLAGISLSERYEVNSNDNSIKKIYNPNFGGAYTSLTGNEYIFVSPNRYRNILTTSYTTAIEGAVTPLEAISYAGPYQDHGGSTSRPAIDRDMKSYYNLAIGSSLDPDAVQLDFWSFNAFGIPRGTHNLSASQTLNIIKMFNQLSVYDPATSILQDFSYLLFNPKFSIQLRSQETYIEVTNPANLSVSSITLPTLLTEGVGAILCADTTNTFIMAMVTKVYDDSDDLTQVTDLIFENDLIGYSADVLPEMSLKGHTLGVKIKNEGSDIERRSGWIGCRTYILFDHDYDSIKARINVLYESQLIESLLPNDGLYVYERPAII